MRFIGLFPNLLLFVQQLLKTCRVVLYALGTKEGRKQGRNGENAGPLPPLPDPARQVNMNTYISIHEQAYQRHVAGHQIGWSYNDQLAYVATAWARWQLETIKELTYMADKKPGKSTWKGFVSYRLTQADRAAFDEWFPKLDLDLAEILDRLTGNGFKVTVKFDPERSSFIAAATGVFCKKSWEGYTTSSWADGIRKSLAITLFKLENLWEWEHRPDEDEKGGDSWG
jgi:hypothetical protein